MSSRLRQLINWPRRWRVSHGFGVHSPFAYSLITKVIRDHYAYYYAFSEIDLLCGKKTHSTLLDNMIFSCADYSREEAHLLFRLLCHFNPEEIVDVGGSNEVSRTIIERAVPHAKLYRWNRQNFGVLQARKPAFDIVNYVLDENFTVARKFLLAAIHQGPGRIVIFRNLQRHCTRRLYDQVTNSVNFGMTFHDDYFGIFAALPSLPRLDFPMLIE